MATTDRRKQRPAEPAEVPEPASTAVEPGYRIAAEPLFVTGNALAHVPGDRVPLDNVERHGWHDKVIMPPPDPPPHVAIPAQAEPESSDVDSGDGAGRPDHA